MSREKVPSLSIADGFIVSSTNSVACFLVSSLCIFFLRSICSCVCNFGLAISLRCCSFNFLSFQNLCSLNFSALQPNLDSFSPSAPKIFLSIFANTFSSLAIASFSLSLASGEVFAASTSVSSLILVLISSCRFFACLSKSEPFLAPARFSCMAVLYLLRSSRETGRFRLNRASISFSSATLL